MKSNNHITRKNSEKYEEILTAFLIDKYELPGKYKKYITKYSHDGGYDALFKMGNNDKEKIILMESKLRSNIYNDLKLADFAKSFVIAINLSADILYIGTNLHLSNNTILQLSKFQKYTGLEWGYIDPVTLFEWDKFKNFEISNSLYHLIESSKNVFIEKKYLKRDEIEDVLPQKTPYSDELSFMNNDRISKSDILLKYLSSYNVNKIVGVFGAAGNGKSFFIKKTLNKYVERNRNCQVIKIDLSNYNYPCILFINIIEKFWLTKKDLLFEENWEDVLKYILPNEFSEKAIKKVADILSNHYAEEENDPILIEFLAKCFYKISSKRNIVFYFENINKTSEVIINFILYFSNLIKDEAKIIFEIRNSLYIDGKMEEEKWNNYIKKFELLCNEKIYFAPLINDDIYKLIDDTINVNNKLTVKSKKQILKYLGLSPLIISNFISYLNIEFFNRNEQINNIEYEILKTLKDYKNSNYLDLNFITLSQRNNSYSIVFYFAYLFDGKIPKELLEAYLDDQKKKYLPYEVIVNTLKEANLFLEINNVLKIKHLLLLECVNLENHKNIMPENITATAKKILDIIYVSKPNLNNLNSAKIKIFDELNKYILAANLNFKLAVHMYKLGEYKLCYEYACKAYDEINKHLLYNPETLGNILLEIKILITIIQVSGFIKKDTHLYLEQRVCQVKRIFNNNKKSLEKLKVFYNLYGHYSMILSRYYIHFGKYDISYKIMKNAYNKISKNKNAPIEMRLHIVWEYGITLKHYKGIDSEIKILKKWLKKYSLSDGLNITYCSSLYSKYIFIKPKLAAKYCKKNIKNKEITEEIATHIHIDVHNYNMNTVLKKYGTVETDILNNEEKIKNCGLNNELGRCYHILAFINSIKGNKEKAYNYYKEALNLLDNKSYIEYIFTILLDFLVFCFENEYYNELDNIVKNFLDIITTEYKYSIENIIPYKIEYSNTYMEIILFIYELKKNNYIGIDYINILKTNIQCKKLERFYDKDYQSVYFKRLFKRTHYFHDNYVFSGC